MTAVAARGRGRPRPEETVTRDQLTLKLLARGPLSRTELANRLGNLDQNLAYLSLYRLGKRGLVERVPAAAGDYKPNTWQLTAQGRREASR